MYPHDQKIIELLENLKHDADVVGAFVRVYGGKGIYWPEAYPFLQANLTAIKTHAFHPTITPGKENT